MGRVPALQTAGINELINGPESFTPDGNFILGEAPELKNFFVGAGFNAFGIAAGGGAGMALAEWVHRGVAPYDLWVVDIRRFGRPHQDTDWVRTRTLEAYGKHYTMAWPYEEHDSGRPCRLSPLYSRLLDAGCVLRREARVGAAQLVRLRRARRDASRRLQLRAAELVRCCRPRASRRARGGGVDRSDVVRQVRAEGPRRVGRVELDLREQRRQAGRVADVHADARRLRWHPMRPDRVPRRRPTSSTSSPAPASPRTTSTGSSVRFRPAMNAQLFDITSANTRAVADGTAIARHPAAPSPAPTCRTRRSRSARNRSSASPGARCGHCASRTSASSAGSCTCRSSTPPRCTTR